MNHRGTFIVVLRGQTGLSWPPDGAFTVNAFPSPNGPVTVVLRTHRMHQEGFSKPVARGLHIEVTGGAPDLRTAIVEFTEVAELIVPILCTTVNAPIAQVQPEIAYESTPGLKERPYFQQYLVWPSRKPLKPRRVDNRLLSAVLKALPSAPRTERIHRAMSYYHQALLGWIPGGELLSLSLLWMGIEAMTPVVRDQHLLDCGLSREALLQKWQIELKMFDAEVRRRLIFGNDLEAYEKAKDASDGLEHGFGAFTELRNRAAEVFLPAAAALRKAILSHTGLAQAVIDELLSAEYARPFPLFHQKFLFATLQAPTDSLSAPNQLYPYLNWSTTMVEVPTPPESDPAISFRDTFTFHAAEGVQISGINVRAAMPRTDPHSGS